jgi:hypothetical protein
MFYYKLFIINMLTVFLGEIIINKWKYFVGLFFIIAYYLIRDYLCKIKIDPSSAE